MDELLIVLHLINFDSYPATWIYVQNISTAQIYIPLSNILAKLLIINSKPTDFSKALDLVLMQSTVQT